MTDIEQKRLLLEVAKAEFNQNASHVVELEGKAKTYLTLNALMMSAGVFAMFKTGFPQANSFCSRSFIGALLVLLLVTLAASYHRLLAVLAVRLHTGVPEAASVVSGYEKRSHAQLLEGLTEYYSTRSAQNTRETQGTSRLLREAVRFSKYGFAVFFVLIISLTWLQIMQTEYSMNNNFNSMPPLSGGDGESSDSHEDDSPPPEITETIIEKGPKGAGGAADE